MKFKKFKHDLKKENLIIPSMSDELNNYSKMVIKNKTITTHNEESAKTKINWFRYLNRVIPALTILIIVLVLVLAGNPFKKPFEDINGYELYTVQNEGDFKRILNYNKTDEDLDINGEQGEQGEQGKPGEAGDKGDKGDSSSSGDSYKPNYSNTNLQEMNVDEGDIVKTDGKSIYYVNSDRGLLYNYKISSKKLTSVDINESLVVNLATPLMYITDKYVIILQSYYIVDITPVEKKISFTVYDKNTLQVKKNYVGNGDYVDSRLTDDTLYFIYLKKDVNELPNDEIDNKLNNYNYEDIKYSSTNINKGYTFIVALNMNKLKLNVQIQLGVNAWNAVYMTEKSLYLVSSNLSSVYKKYTINGSFYTEGYQTNIFRYELDGINISCSGAIYTSGMVKNQFYLDEYDNHLRVVLEDTITDVRKLEIYSLNSKSNYGSYVKVAYIDKGIGNPGETIESVKFEDKSCLIVTYLKVVNKDPLYYIDLTDQYNPKIVSGYNEPGYNSYLHYLSDDLAIGFGIIGDVLEFDVKDGNIYFLRSKMTLYEIKDGVLNEIKEVLFYDSEVLSNHKSLYIENNIFGYNLENFKYKANNSSSSKLIEESCYVIYSVVYEARKPKLRLLKQFSSDDNTYKRMIRVEDNYYLVSEKYIEILDNNFEIIESVEITK